MTSFTVITCTYNASSVIERTLLSVLNQSYDNIEHLIIDGASKDDTLQIVAKHNSEGRITVVSERDKGLYDAMNKGIARANGDYIVFLNAGDCFSSADTLAGIAQCVDEYMKQNDGKSAPGVLYGNTDIVDDEGRFLRKRRLAPPEALNWRSFREGMLVCHQSFYARTDIAKRTPYAMDYPISADVDWCIRIMKDCEREKLDLLNTHRTLTSYLDGGMSLKNHRASLLERFRIMCRHYGVISTVGMHMWFVVRAVLKK